MPAKAEFGKGFWIMMGVLGAVLIAGIIYSLAGKAVS